MIDTDINDFKIGDFVVGYNYHRTDKDGNCDRGPYLQRTLGPVTDINSNIITINDSSFCKFHYKQCRLVTEAEGIKLRVKSELDTLLINLVEIDKFIENSKDLHFSVKRKYKGMIEFVKNNLGYYDTSTTS